MKECSQKFHTESNFISLLLGESIISLTHKTNLEETKFYFTSSTFVIIPMSQKLHGRED